MNENKRTNSISKKINRRSVLNMLCTFILMDVLVFVLISAAWCYNIESLSSSKLEWNSPRYFTSVHQLKSTAGQAASPDISKEDYNTALIIKNKKSNTIKSLVFPQNFSKLLKNSVYIYETSHGKLKCAYSGFFLSSLFSLMYILLFLQILILLTKVFSGTHKIRRALAPLDELAFKAQVLSEAAEFEPQAFEELEKAINEISPAKEGSHINTGNAEMEHLEHSINNLLDRMRDSYRQQTRFVSDASHELRTPLAVLQGYVNMLDRWGKKDETILDESIEAIKNETEHMKKLVEQLLFLARGDSGKTILNLESFSLNDMMQEVYEESLMIDKNHHYQFIPAPEDITVLADISMLKQTARILIDNAAKYTPEGSAIFLKVRYSEDLNPVMIIQDEGIGISGSDISHMFDRFFRSDPARTKDSGGAGLGLSIAKWIVDRHGGYFDVLSREDIGTRISIILPQKQSKNTQ